MIITEDSRIHREEVYVLRQGEETMALWIGDMVSLIPKEGIQYQGSVGWSIDSFYLTLSETKGSIAINYNFAWRNIQEIDIVDYSSKRPNAEKQREQVKYNKGRNVYVLDGN